MIARIPSECRVFFVPNEKRRALASNAIPNNCSN